MVEHEYCSTSKPLAIELTPDSLAPTSISHRQVQRTLVQVVPEDTSGQMAHGVEVVVSHHLRLTAGTRGEVHNHGVLVVIDEGWTLELRCLLPF